MRDPRVCCWPIAVDAWLLGKNTTIKEMRIQMQSCCGVNLQAGLQSSCVVGKDRDLRGMRNCCRI